MNYTVEQICRAHGISRQAYYQGRRRSDQRAESKEAALQVVRSVRAEHPRLGTRKLYQLHKKRFRALGFGRDKLFDLLREEGLLVKPRRRRRSTTNSRHRFRTYENLLADYTPTEPNDVWVSDITYLETKDGFRYASLITDAYSRKIIGYQLSDSLSVEGSLAALKQALRQASPGDLEGLIHHSDQGVQYCCHAYVETLERRGVNVSMAAAGNPYENAKAERVNGTLKQEYFLDALFESEAQAEAALDEAVRLYNERRPHLALDYCTPADVHRNGPSRPTA